MEYTVEMMCRVFTISRSSYYKWKKNPAGRRRECRRKIQQDIKDAYDLAKGRYGSPRITEELRATGTSVSRRTVAKHMKEMGLRSKVWRRYKITTDSSHKEPRDKASIAAYLRLLYNLIPNYALGKNIFSNA